MTVVNLRQVRKARQRAEATAQAAANRAAFGRTRQEKATTTAEAERAGRLLDGAKRDS